MSKSRARKENQSLELMRWVYLFALIVAMAVLLSKQDGSTLAVLSWQAIVQNALSNCTKFGLIFLFAHVGKSIFPIASGDSKNELDKPSKSDSKDASHVGSKEPKNTDDELPIIHKIEPHTNSRPRRRRSDD